MNAASGSTWDGKVCLLSRAINSQCRIPVPESALPGGFVAASIRAAQYPETFVSKRRWPDRSRARAGLVGTALFRILRLTLRVVLRVLVHECLRRPPIRDRRYRKQRRWEFCPQRDRCCAER